MILLLSFEVVVLPKIKPPNYRFMEKLYDLFLLSNRLLIILNDLQKEKMCVHPTITQMAAPLHALDLNSTHNY